VIDRRLLKNLDYKLVLAMLALLGLGFAAISSAGRGHSSGLAFVERQASWAVIGFGLFVLGLAIDHHTYLRAAKGIYVANLLLLASVFAGIGHQAKGAQRWIGIGPFALQPSEFAKLFLVITLAAFLVRNQANIREFRVVVKSFLHLAVPMLLIFKQPDLGTALVLTAVWFGMLFIGGADIKHLAAFFATGLLLGVGMWHAGVLKDYQKARLESFINPDADPRGSGYHIRQSRIAIGSGRFYGKGLFHGTQSQLRFIPEQHTDFIFTVIGEELGFIGAATVVILYFILLWRGLVTMEENEDPGGRLIAAGIVSMFFFHVMVNIGMTLGIMPVTGVPLPLLSYGGSSLLASMLSLGVLAGIYARRHKITF
jgi:rod shape determining protein RodA